MNKLTMRSFFTLLVLFGSLLFLESCSTGDPVTKIVQGQLKDEILKRAENYLNEQPLTVTAYRSERSAGGVHDFFSEGDY